MSWNSLLNFFKKEKNFVGRLAEDFSRKFPKVAGFLDFSLESSDPQVNRLLESLSFLHAMTQKKMTGEFEEISTGILQVLAPNMVSPIVPMTTVQFDDKDGGKVLPSQSELGIHTEDGELCQFRTGFSVEVLPLKITEAQFESPSIYHELNGRGDVHKVLKIRIQCEEDKQLSDLELGTIRMHLAGESMIVSSIYDIVFGDTIGVATRTDTEKKFSFLPSQSITPVGFNSDEMLMPLSDNVQLSYQLLMEYFCFPAKYHYFDIHKLSSADCSKYLDILILVAANSGSALDVSADNFKLNATPAINLFDKELSPILLDQNTHEYLLTASNNLTNEVHSIRSVSTSSENSQSSEMIEPFFQLRQKEADYSERSFWTTRREMSYVEGVNGSNSYISFVNMDYGNQTPGGKKVFANALCSNRVLAEKLTNKSRLFLKEDPEGCLAYCLTPPTAAVQPALGGASLWQLVNSLNLNFASLTHKDDLEALKQNIALYNFNSRAVNDQQIEGIRAMEIDLIIRRRNKQGWHCFYQGLEVVLTIDQSYFIGSSPVLFGKVIHEFLSLYVSADSFVELVLTRTNQEGEWIRFKKQAGRKPTFL